MVELAVLVLSKIASVLAPGTRSRLQLAGLDQSPEPIHISSTVASAGILAKSG